MIFNETKAPTENNVLSPIVVTNGQLMGWEQREELEMDFWNTLVDDLQFPIFVQLSLSDERFAIVPKVGVLELVETEEEFYHKNNPDVYCSPWYKTKDGEYYVDRPHPLINVDDDDKETDDCISHTYFLVPVKDTLPF